VHGFDNSDQKITSEPPIKLISDFTLSRLKDDLVKIVKDPGLGFPIKELLKLDFVGLTAADLQLKGSSVKVQVSWKSKKVGSKSYDYTWLYKQVEKHIKNTYENENFTDLSVERRPVDYNFLADETSEPWVKEDNKS